MVWRSYTSKGVEWPAAIIVAIVRYCSACAIVPLYPHELTPHVLLTAV